MQEDHDRSVILNNYRAAAAHGIRQKPMAGGKISVRPIGHTNFQQHKVDAVGLEKLLSAECDRLWQADQQAQQQFAAEKKHLMGRDAAINKLEDELISKGHLPPLAASVRRRYDAEHRRAMKHPSRRWPPEPGLRTAEFMLTCGYQVGEGVHRMAQNNSHLRGGELESLSAAILMPRQACVAADVIELA